MPLQTVDALAAIARMPEGTIFYGTNDYHGPPIWGWITVGPRVEVGEPRKLREFHFLTNRRDTYEYSDHRHTFDRWYKYTIRRWGRRGEVHAFPPR